MLQRCAVVVSLLTFLLCASGGDAPITWPDARHFRVIPDPQWGNALTLHWPVKEYCPQNDLLEFSASITKVGDGMFRRNVSGTSERLDATLEQSEAAYLITAEMKTKFNVHGVSATATITTGESPRFGSRPSRRVQEAFEVRVVGDGPFVVVLKHRATEECLLIIYGETPSESFTIEAVDICRGEKRASMAIALPIKTQPVESLPKTRLLKFDLPSDLLTPLPRFNVQAYSLSNRARVELDPPCDIYGKLELTSPKTARLIVTFRPPASHPRFIRTFTFVFSRSNETIVIKVVDDKDSFYHDTKNTIGYSELLRAQHNKTMHFEVCPKALYEYPGNYTVTAHTNSAVNQKAVHPIIMPEFWYGTTPSSSTTSTTVSASTPKVVEEVAAEKRTEAASTTTQQQVPPGTTQSTISTAGKFEASTSEITKPCDQRDSALSPGDPTKGHVNTTTVLLAVFGCLGPFLLVAIFGLILQKWRQKNAAKMFENPPPADLPPLYS